jgi:hypothetical protein
MVGIRRRAGTTSSQSSAPRPWDRQELTAVKSNELLGLFGFTRHLGFDRSAQPFGFVRLRGDSNPPPARRDGPRLDGRWEPHFRRLTTAI